MTALSSGMYLHTAGAEERPEEAYCGWTLRDRLELLAFDARLAGVPPALLEALWEAIDGLVTGPRAIVSYFRSADSIST